MTAQKLMTRILMAGLALYALAGIARAGTDLAGEFVTPPDSAKPWVNMWWFDEITPANITQHLEELKAKGVGGVMLIDTSSMPELWNPVAGQRCYLDLGTVKDTARVRLNGKDLGVVWCPPWRAEITGAAKPGENALEIEVVNLWPNRLIGDSKLPDGQRRTRTGLKINIVDTREPVAALVGWLSKDLLPSGLLGPLTLQTTLP
jgi:hypothetical protein